MRAYRNFFPVQLNLWRFFLVYPYNSKLRTSDLNAVHTLKKRLYIFQMSFPKVMPLFSAFRWLTEPLLTKNCNSVLSSVTPTHTQTHEKKTEQWEEKVLIKNPNVPARHEKLNRENENATFMQ